MTISCSGGAARRLRKLRYCLKWENNRGRQGFTYEASTATNLERRALDVIFERKAMSLLELDALTAWDNVFAKRGLARWPGSGARFLPFATPDFDISFKIEPGAKVFSIGSCFARNIEVELVKHGFDAVAVRHLGNAELMNKYNPYSMLDEVKWAIGEQPRLTIDQRLFEVGDNAYVDMHLHQGAPISKEDCIQNVALSNALHSELIACPYIIITLGLAEIWYDNETATCLNEPANIIRFYRHSDSVKELFRKRFVFRVMDYFEVYTATRDLIDALRKASKACKIILTVSPVPMSTTFSGKEILSANMYSKSVLRAAAEQVCAGFEHVDYFPSYESVMLSPRDTTWKDDYLHLKQEVVSLNVERMIERYTS